MDGGGKEERGEKTEKDSDEPRTGDNPEQASSRLRTISPHCASPYTASPSSYFRSLLTSIMLQLYALSYAVRELSSITLEV